MNMPPLPWTLGDARVRVETKRVVVSTLGLTIPTELRPERMKEIWAALGAEPGTVTAEFPAPVLLNRFGLTICIGEARVRRCLSKRFYGVLAERETGRRKGLEREHEDGIGVGPGDGRAGGGRDGGVLRATARDRAGAA